MSQLFAGSLALILAITLWGLGKKLPIKLKGIYSKQDYILGEDTEIGLLSKNNKNQATSNREQATSNRENESKWDLPKENIEKINLRKKLFKLMKSTPEDRIYAIEIALKWGDACILPIIRQGLKDSESEIVVLAAKGIEKFKNNSLKKINHSRTSLPLNIFLMR